MTKFIIFISIAIAIGIIVSLINSRKRKKTFKKLGFNPKDAFVTGKYALGHPDIDEEKPLTEMVVIDGNINIFSKSVNAKMKLEGKIPVEQVKNITIEDASTMEKKVTAGRLLAIGVFAFAFKKKKKEEMSYLCIEWNDGKFDHETVFEFVGKFAIQDGNSARNKLIKYVR